MCSFLCIFFFFFKNTATTEIYTLSLHDALPIFRAFVGFQPPLYELSSGEGNGEPHMRGRVMMVEVCNGTTAGGAYRFAPRADPADGFLDVCVVRQISWGRF